MHSLSATHDWHCSRLPLGVLVHMDVIGSQLFPPQRAASVATVHCTHVPPSQTWRIPRSAQSAFSKQAAHSPTLLQRDSIGF
jgi:hypothetical protein